MSAHLNKKARKALARRGIDTSQFPSAPKVPMLPAPWLSSGSMVAKTSVMFPSQVPRAPKVYYSDKAWAKIAYFVNRAKGEVGWLGLVERRGTNYLVTDVFLPEQEVSAATTEISVDAYNKIMFECIRDGVYNDNLCYWGHSHVNMSVTPSMTDERTTQGYIESTMDGGFFIRGIYNKSGDSKVDVYQKDGEKSGWIFEAVEDGLLPRALEDAEFRDIAELFTARVITPPPEFLPQRFPVVQPVTNLYNPKAPAEKELLDDLDYGIELDTDPFYGNYEGYRHD